MPRVGSLRALQKFDFGWRELAPHEYGYEHPKHVCDDHCVVIVVVDGYKQRAIRHPWRDAPTESHAQA